MGALLQLILGLFGLGDKSKITALVLGYLLGGGKGAAGAGALSVLVEAFKNKGLGNLVESWVGSGANQPATPNQIKDGIGHDKLSELAKQAGIPVDTLAEKLAKYLPAIIDKLTPAGKLPTA